MEMVLRGPAAEPTKTSGTMNVINDKARGLITEPVTGVGTRAGNVCMAPIKKGEKSVSAAEG